MMLNYSLQFVLRISNTVEEWCYIPIFFDVVELSFAWNLDDRLCGLVVRDSGYRYRGVGFDSRRYQIF